MGKDSSLKKAYLHIKLVQILKELWFVTLTYLANATVLCGTQSLEMVL